MSQVAAGTSHTCARLTTGTVKCWGDNDSGQLGDGTTDDALGPVDVVGLGATVQSVSAGSSLTCALTTGGGVKCMGYNSYGRLGDGTASDSLSMPVEVVGLSSGVVAIDTTHDHACAVLATGGVRCWGRNDRGQAGDGTIVQARSTPVDVIGVDGMAGIAAGLEHSCAVRSDGSVKCWGEDSAVLVGDGDGVAVALFVAQNVVDFGPPGCTLVAPGQTFALAPKPRVSVTQGRYESSVDTLTANGEFALPPGIAFADLQPQLEGARLQLRNGAGRVVSDVHVQGGLYDTVRRRGWKGNASGKSWTFRNTSAVRRLQVGDLSRGAPGGRVRFTVMVRYGYFPLVPGDEPVQLSLTLGDDAAGAAGECGASAFVAADCKFNEPGSRLTCKK